MGHWKSGCVYGEHWGNGRVFLEVESVSQETCLWSVLLHRVHVSCVVGEPEGCLRQVGGPVSHQQKSRCGPGNEKTRYKGILTSNYTHR